MKVRIIVEMDSSNLGVFNRLMEEGSIDKYQVVSTEKKEVDPVKHVADVRRDQKTNHHNGHKHSHRVPGLTTTQCVMAILKRKPAGTVWSSQEIGIILEADFGFQSRSAAAALAILKKHAYATSCSPGNFMIGIKGEKFNEGDWLPSSWDTPLRS